MRIEVPMLPPIEYSPNWRGHWAQRYKAGKVYQMAVFALCVDYRNRQMSASAAWCPFEQSILNLTFVFRDRRKERDEDNLRARFKPGQDALVQAELIKSDTQRHLVMGTITIEVDRKRAPSTIIELEDACKPPQQ